MMLGLIDWSYEAFSDWRRVMPAYVPLSENHASTAGIAARRSAPAALLFARSLKLRYEGIAIAVRIARMIITTRSSIRVKPFSFLSRFRNLSSMVLLPWGFAVARRRIGVALSRSSALERVNPLLRRGRPSGPLRIGRALPIARPG